MSQSARVSSIEAVKDLQAALAAFCQDVREALCAVDMEARRVLEWLLHEQPNQWHRNVRHLQEELAQAKADLFRRQLAGMSGEKLDVIEQREAVWMVQERLREAEEKMEKCRHWSREVQRGW